MNEDKFSAIEGCNIVFIIYINFIIYKKDKIQAMHILA